MTTAEYPANSFANGKDFDEMFYNINFVIRLL